MPFKLRKCFQIATPLQPHLFAGSFIAVLLLLAAPSAAHAQAQVTASREVSIDVYGAATSVSPHFGPDRDFGYTFGGDIQRHFHLLDAALDVRYTSATGNFADESTFMGGFRAGRSYRRFHPYIEVMVGHGNIRFDHPEVFNNPNYTHDDSTVYDGGIGLDYSLTPRFAVKVDAQVQRWRTGLQSQVFNPNTISVGVVYHVPFRYLRLRRY